MTSEPNKKGILSIINFSSFPNKPWVSHVCSKSLLKSLGEKENLLVTSNFSFFHSVFYPSGELSSIFTKFKIDVYKLFRFGSPKFVVWERVKDPVGRRIWEKKKMLLVTISTTEMFA